MNCWNRLRIFLLTRPSRDVTREREQLVAAWRISTHTSLAGRDGALIARRKSKALFLLTRPSRDVTFTAWQDGGATQISTHTSLAGRDVRNVIVGEPSADFYSHVPRGT